MRSRVGPAPNSEPTPMVPASVPPKPMKAPAIF